MSLFLPHTAAAPFLHSRGFDGHYPSHVDGTLTACPPFHSFLKKGNKTTIKVSGDYRFWPVKYEEVLNQWNYTDRLAVYTNSRWILASEGSKNK